MRQAHLAHQTGLTRTGKINMLNRKPYRTAAQKAEARRMAEEGLRHIRQQRAGELPPRGQGEGGVMKDFLAVAFATILALIPIGAVIAAVAAWVTHVYVCIQASAWILLAFGCVVAPVGIIHGVGVWLGAF
ncbi:hypothetical protein [Agrobacterium pusense]|uniref:hypothetical protein n=1 Tax=Agrobacterium pusense TaxID=648995 RepID=UPI000A7C6D4C|nr:hypothetical protein [Agrobacterium pusense]